MTWKPENFLIADNWSPERCHKVAGYTYRHLGIYKCMDGSPKGRRPPTWSLRHLGSGHTICLIDGTVATAFPVASEIAECGDWSFDGLRGWVNVDPDIPEKVRKIMSAYPKQIRHTGGPSSDASAQAIAVARA